MNGCNGYGHTSTTPGTTDSTTPGGIPAVVKHHPSTLGMQKHRDIWCLPTTPEFLLDCVSEFEMKSNDILIVGYPKSGLEWIAKAVWMMHNRPVSSPSSSSSGFSMSNGIRSTAQQLLQQNHSIRGSNRWRDAVGGGGGVGRFTSNKDSEDDDMRVPFLEHRSSRLPDPLSLISSRDSPRLMKTHLSAEFFASNLWYGRPKVVILLRDPRDCLAAQFEWYKSNPYFAFSGDWDDFFQLFRARMLHEADWFDHTELWWSFRNQPNVLVLKFEELHNDPRPSVKRLADFCNRTISVRTSSRRNYHRTADYHNSNGSSNGKSDLDHSSSSGNGDGPSDDNDTHLKMPSVKSQSSHRPSPKCMLSSSSEDCDTICDFIKESIAEDKFTGMWKQYFSAAQSEYIAHLFRCYFYGTGLTFRYSHHSPGSRGAGCHSPKPRRTVTHTTKPRKVCTLPHPKNNRLITPEIQRCH